MGKLLSYGIWPPVDFIYISAYRRNLYFHLLPYKDFQINRSILQTKKVAYIHDYKNVIPFVQLWKTDVEWHATKVL
jgi:hypothetical protein